MRRQQKPPNYTKGPPGVQQRRSGGNNPKEYMEDAPVETIKGSIRKTPRRLLDVHLPRLVAENRQIGGRQHTLTIGRRRGSSKGAGQAASTAPTIKNKQQKQQLFVGAQRVPGGSQQKQTNNLGHRRIGHTLPPKGCAKLPMLVTWFRLSAGRWWYRYLSGSEEYRAGLVSGARIFPVERPPERKTSADIGEWRGE